MYKIGGWTANAGSWSIGFRPNPCFGIGTSSINGLDVKILKLRNPNIIIFCMNKVFNLYFLSKFLVVIKNIKEIKIKTINHNNKLPSWLPHVPVIL